MSQETQNFEHLRRLLKLKRYEQPPFNYFHNFSTQVLHRIELAESGEHDSPMIAPFPGHASWVQQVVAALVSRPAVLGAFSLAICASLVAGVTNSGRSGIKIAARIQDTPPSKCSRDELEQARAAIDPPRATPAVCNTSSFDPVTAMPVSEQ